MARAVYVTATWADGQADRFKVRGPALLPKLLGHTSVTVGRTVHTRNVDVVMNPLGHQPTSGTKRPMCGSIGGMGWWVSSGAT